MSCLSDKSSLGFVRISTDKVIKSCESTLRGIDKNRSKDRRANINENLSNLMWTWSIFWKWLGFKKPTLRNAIFVYVDGNSNITQKYIVDYRYNKLENDVVTLMKSASMSERNHMWVSSETVRLMTTY